MFNRIYKFTNKVQCHKHEVKEVSVFLTSACEYINHATGTIDTIPFSRSLL
jgi:hypothetical protein